MLDGIKRVYFRTGKLGCAWVGAWCGAWVVDDVMVGGGIKGTCILPGLVMLDLSIGSNLVWMLML